MMNKVFKYEVKISKEPQQLELPGGYEILHFGCQNGGLFIWVSVNPSNPVVPVSVLVIGTGWEFNRETCHYMGTAQDLWGYVWHCFEVYDEVNFDEVDVDEVDSMLI